MRAERLQRVQDRMVDLGVDALCLSVGADLPWLTGYTAMPLERLTMLVVRPDERPVLFVPELEAPRVEPVDDLFAVEPWGELDDPVALVAAKLGRARRVAIDDRTWARFLLALQQALPGSTFSPGSHVTAPLRAVKDEGEIAALARAGAAADQVAAALVGGEIALSGRTEADVAHELAERLRDAGHDRINFVIVGSGPNAASPHHDPTERVIGVGESVVCDFGGTVAGYCSDTTRTVVTQRPPDGFAEAYSVLRDAQAAAVEAAVVGSSCHDVDATARDRLAAAGWGDRFIHRTGHGIGIEAHEDPYLVAGNHEPIVAGHAFSVEPGIYVPGAWGARIEDIVVAAADGPRSLNRVDHGLAAVP